MSNPQRSKRARTLNLCPDCGQKIINRGAHYEACPGSWAPKWGIDTRRCEHRVPGYGHGVWRYCVRPWNHQGEHIY